MKKEELSYKEFKKIVEEVEKKGKYYHCRNKPKNKPVRVIILTGQAGSGKTTAAEFLNKNISNSVIINYGDALKWVAERFYGWNGEKNEIGRTLLQQLGTEVGRAKNPDIWLNIVKLVSLNVLPFNDKETKTIIIGDARFDNEVLGWDGSDRTVIQVGRDDNQQNLYTVEQTLHASEQGVSEDLIDHFVYENSVEDLYDELTRIAEDERWFL